MGQFGVKSITNRTLAQLLAGLKVLYSEDHKYATLFCRYLQVYHPDPVDTLLATFLTKIRKDFEEMKKQYAESLKKSGAKAAPAVDAKGKEINPGKKFLDDLQCGGEGPLFDAL